MKNLKPHKNSRVVKIGSLKIGGGNPIAVQSMTKTNSHDVRATIKQIKELEEVGCEMIRVAIPTIEAAKKLKDIKKGINIPLIADIHFDYRLAIESIKQGADKIRINPGNINSRLKVKEIIKACKEREIPIRVGGNTGSLKEKYLKKFKGPTPEALIESVLDEIRIIESLNFDSIVVSLKSSNVRTMIEANHLFSSISDYPLHLGVTEAGLPGRGEIPSAIGIGTLLYEGIGDTIRVSLTGDPILEVKAAYNILGTLNLRNMGVRIISCPTCGRLEYDMLSVLASVLKLVRNLKKPLTIAIMGCSVNGPGEAKEADIGIAGGKKSAVIFKKGKIVATVNEENLIDAFLSELNSLI
ncbi:4-hydroxy-3-methylbut-2-en-1-yl diphosphate synthase (flavodoxin) [subsurface metagenome]